MVAPATHILFVLWLLVASTYWKLSYGVSVHTHLECIPQCHYKQRSKTPTLLCELNVLHCSYKLNKTNNVYFCFKNKNIHYERHKKKIIVKYITYIRIFLVNHQTRMKTTPPLLPTIT